MLCCLLWRDRRVIASLYLRQTAMVTVAEEEPDHAVIYRKGCVTGMHLITEAVQHL